MKKDSRYIWYIIDTVVYLAINIFILTNFPIDFEELADSVSWFEFIIFALGIYRLTDIITKESVTDFIRAPFMDKSSDGTWKESEQGIRGFFATLLSCNACMGVWVAMIVVYLYIFLGDPILIFLIIMSLTGFERFFSKFENYLEKK